MDERIVNFKVSSLAAQVAEGVYLTWQGKQFDSGPLTVELDENASDDANQGVLDYSRRRARADFHVRLRFPELASILEGLGVDPELTQPVSAVLHSEGAILEDHGFEFSGPCDLASHTLFPPQETTASVLPGLGTPDAGSRSGAEIQQALVRGESVSWRFAPLQKRLRLTLPKSFGGRTYEVCLRGGYTFLPVVSASAAA